MTVNNVDIYILEPDDLFRKIIYRTIKDIKMDAQINIYTYADGYEFIRDVKGVDNFALYIVNDILPKKNGLEVAGHIRSFDNKSIIYFMTRSETEEDMLYALNLGVDNYFVKPLNLKLFQSIIKNRIIRGGLA
ncbi:two-component response regulator [Jeotgalicoccus saudimassiliensis]|uniref:Two-component response regulator n=1 Tax=Jeotgalicoccus saudimassiliensis TaxID=1461582 RepID=A0A078M0W4_9STAP|nr:response regulator [Jeotgalicoccus saudimassiliensis]CEA01003.1 two-component response regulator [Jeotgalicoccus saudimassiliensis]